VNRVTWLRAKARWDRCSEQKKTVEMEMIWSYLGLLRRCHDWRARRQTEQSRGMQAYAAKQEATWNGLAMRAWNEFGVQRIVEGLRETIGEIDLNVDLM
jgi:hypothetical protein